MSIEIGKMAKRVATPPKQQHGKSVVIKADDLFSLVVYAFVEGSVRWGHIEVPQITPDWNRSRTKEWLHEVLDGQIQNYPTDKG